MRRIAVIAVVVVGLAVLGAGWLYWRPAAMPAGQPPLLEITPATIERLRAEFNAAADHPRLIALLSPT